MERGRLILSVLAILSVAALAGAQDAAPASPPVHVVLFTHIEDNTPPGALGTAANRDNYLAWRGRLLEMGTLARLHDVRWSLQPDWKFLVAALQYESGEAMSSTGGLNVLRYLRDVLGVHIDPHSHESGGYNYTDVALLLDMLGVGGSRVIGGHIWDPALPQFQEWDRFREPVRGLRFPAATWQGDILMGSGTPNHVNDPIVSGVWRPRDRGDYFADDPAANIACVGAFRGDLAGIAELIDLKRRGQVGPDCLLTSTYHIRPADLSGPGGLARIEASVLAPLTALRAEGAVVLTDFTALVATWRTQLAGHACLVQEVR